MHAEVCWRGTDVDQLSATSRTAVAHVRKSYESVNYMRLPKHLAYHVSLTIKSCTAHLHEPLLRVSSCRELSVDCRLTAVAGCTWESEVAYAMRADHKLWSIFVWNTTQLTLHSAYISWKQAVPSHVVNVSKPGPLAGRTFVNQLYGCLTSSKSNMVQLVESKFVQRQAGATECLYWLHTGSGAHVVNVSEPDPLVVHFVM